MYLQWHLQVYMKISFEDQLHLKATFFWLSQNSGIIIQ